MSCRYRLWRDGQASGPGASGWGWPGAWAGALAGRLQLAMTTCLPRATLSAPGGVCLVMVEPPPTVPPAPRVTGATRTQLLPTWTSASITVRCLLAPS